MSGDVGSASDAELMARALTVAERGRRSAPPNPWVGCVLAKDGSIVGEGHHVRPGEAHAEVAALRDAGERARGATAYVTLEPCAHTHRTGPCADALIDAGVTRVVAAVEDPDTQVRGRGFERLRDAGIEVVIGIGADEVNGSLAPYLHHRRTGRAYCLAKVAMTLDGCIAAADGTTTWVTAEASRQDAHKLRAECQAIVVGSGTALTDRPTLSVRGVADAPIVPLRVLLDARGRTPAEGPLFDTSIAPTLVLTIDETAGGPAGDRWRAAGAKVEAVAKSAHGEGVDLEAVLAVLGAHGVLQAMFEGGAQVHGALHAAGLIDRLVAYVAPTLFGVDGVRAFAVTGLSTLAAAAPFELVAARRIDDDVRLDYLRTGVQD